MRDRTAPLTILSLLACAALTGCQVVTNSQYAEVRLIEVAPHAPAVDLYQNSSPVLYSIASGTTTSYMAIPAGSYTFSVNPAGLRQPLASASGSFAAGAQYTVLVADTTANLQMSILKDQTAPAPANQAALRFLHEGTRAGAVDLYLLAPGARLVNTPPFATDVAFGHAPAYLNLPSGTFSLVALPAGAPASAASAPLYAGNQSEYSAGSARTVVLFDATSTDTPALQALTVEDFVPES